MLAPRPGLRASHFLLAHATVQKQMTTVADLGQTIDGEFVIIHGGDRNPCRGVAFYYKGLIGPEQRIRAECGTYMNGDKPKGGDEIFCSTCGDKIHASDFVIYLSLVTAHKLAGNDDAGDSR